jgi:hypothetical protein
MRTSLVSRFARITWLLSAIIVACVWVAHVRAATFANPTTITVPSSGLASPYPSGIVVSGLVGTVRRLTVTIKSFSHFRPDDVDVVLVGPTGQALVLMSDVGDSLTVTSHTLTFSDTAASLLPDEGQIGGGIGTTVYRPTNVGAGDVFQAPGPGTAYSDPAPAGAATLNGTFGGTNPNGTWNLFVVDDTSGESGSLTGGWSLNIVTAPLDYDHDAITDWVVVRNTGPAGLLTWFMLNSVGFTAVPFGADGDWGLDGDYDGDGKSDVAVWRPGAQAVFYIQRSSNGTLLGQAFGQTGDLPTIIGDYDGDGRTDIAVYRPGAASMWHILRSSNGSYLAQQWGQTGDRPVTGDYDGDHKADFAIRRDAGGGVGVFYVLQSTAGMMAVQWGANNDFIVPGDYDGDGKTDIAVARSVSNTWHWYIRRSSDSGFTAHAFGLSAVDFFAQGEYDGDGRTDIGVWRQSGTPGQTAFYALLSSSGALLVQQWGQQGDTLPFVHVY